ncbi:NeuD/PglB/VioB family sugar acetyltransferase [Mariniphaga sp.]|uniref:NeuD/PglB/VioB family sugar acetyltransferase n=1 Tax=Mariniphaga sp. TaxID=1954475 RepID=UPI003561CDCF
MKNLIIIGAGGMGREISHHATLCKGYNTEFKIKGFLDDDKDALNGFKGYPIIIDTIHHYIPEHDDVFVCSMGDVVKKKRSIDIILDKGGEFINLIHPDASISKNVKMGKGCIILKNAFIGVECEIQDYALIQESAIIGHDVKIGKYSRVDCHVVCVGGIEVKDEVTIHSSAVINDRVIVEKGAVVGALSFVIRRVKENTTVFGNPAKKL